jgi:glutamate 5-kinase
MNIREKVQNSHRIIFKFGTNVLTREDGNIALSRIYSFLESIAELKKQRKEIIIVTSGAVGFGAKKIGMSKPTLATLRKACAAVGQGQLMSIYEEGFEKLSITTSQVLLTDDDFSIRERYLSLRNTLNTLLELGVIPIINENDTISTHDLKYSKPDGTMVSFTDNDKLAALVVSKLDADLLIMLSDVDGLYDDDPRVNKEAKIIPMVQEFTTDIESLGFEASKKGRGGMKTKLEAAKIVVHSGGMAIIANGKRPDVIKQIFKGEEVGTIFLPVEHLSSKKRWIAYATNIVGLIKVNKGARKALVENFASLLPTGIIDVINGFNKGDVVSIIDEDDNEFARGIVYYSSMECKKLIGKQTDEIECILGYKDCDEIINRDNIVILCDTKSE